jgi:hypothetical protein
MVSENDLIVYDKNSPGFPASDKGYQFMNRHEGLVMLTATTINSCSEKEEKVTTAPN